MSKDVQKHIPATRNLMLQVMLWKMDECWNHKQLWLEDYNGMEGVVISSNNWERATGKNQ